MAAGAPKRDAEFSERLLGIGTANICYRIGYYGTSAIYEMFFRGQN